MAVAILVVVFAVEVVLFEVVTGMVVIVVRMTHGVMINMRTFLRSACHQYWRVGSSLD